MIQRFFSSPRRKFLTVVALIGLAIAAWAGMYLGGKFSDWWFRAFYETWNYKQPELVITALIFYFEAKVWHLYDVQNSGSPFGSNERIGHIVHQSPAYILRELRMAWLRWIFGFVLWKTSSWRERAWRIVKILLLTIVGLWLFSAVLPDFRESLRFIVWTFLIVYTLYCVAIVLLLHYRGTSLSANKSGKLHASGYVKLIQIVSDEIVDAERIDSNKWSNVHRPLFFPEYGDLAVSLKNETGGTFLLKGFPVEATMALIQAAVGASRVSRAAKEATSQIQVAEELQQRGFMGPVKRVRNTRRSRRSGP